MKKSARLIAVLLSILMLVAIVPLSASAVGIMEVVIDGKNYSVGTDNISVGGGTISASTGNGQFTTLNINGISVNKLKITSVSGTKDPRILFSGNNTIAFTGFEESNYEEHFAALTYTANTKSLRIQGATDDATLNISYKQPANSGTSMPGDYGLYSGIYASGAVSITTCGNVNVTVETDYTEGGLTAQNGYIATTGIDANGVYINTSANTDHAVVVVDATANQAPGADNDGYLYGINSRSDLYLGGTAKVLVRTNSKDADSKTYAACVNVKGGKLYYTGTYDYSKVFCGTFTCTSMNKEIKTFSAAPTIVYSPTYPADKYPSAGSFDSNYYTTTFTNATTTKISIKDGYFFKGAYFAFEGNFNMEGVTSFKVSPEGCSVTEYNSAYFKRSPDITFDGDKFIISGTPIAAGTPDNAFTVRITGTDKDNKPHSFNAVFSMAIRNANIYEYYKPVKKGESFKVWGENYNGYDERYEDPLGYYFLYDEAYSVSCTGGNGRITGNTVMPAENRYLKKMVSDLNINQYMSDTLFGEDRTTAFSATGTAPTSMYMAEYFTYLDYPRSGSAIPTVYRCRIMSVDSTDNIFSDYLVVGKEDKKGFSRTSGEQTVFSTNAADFGMDISKLALGSSNVLELKGTPTKTGEIYVLYSVVKNGTRGLTETRYYRTFTVIGSEPVERIRPNAIVGVPYDDSIENDMGSISPRCSTTSRAGLTASNGIYSRIYGTPTQTGTYYSIVLVTKDGKETYYKDIVTVVEKGGDATITQQPKGGTVKAGEKINLSIKATGDDLSYLWVLVTENGTKETSLNSFSGASGYNTNNATFSAAAKACGNEDGQYVFRCYVNGVKSDDAVFTIEHIEGESVKEKESPASCTTKGYYQEVVYCTVCNAEISRKDVITDKAHVPGDPVNENIVPATATTPGSHVEVIYCKQCGAVIRKRNVTDPFVITKYLTGDVDNSGKVDVTDARLCLRRAIKLENYSVTSLEYLACDVDNNSKIDVTDARLILRYAIKLDTSFPADKAPV